jgi:hypothetical protein
MHKTEGCISVCSKKEGSMNSDQDSLLNLCQI